MRVWNPRPEELELGLMRIVRGVVQWVIMRVRSSGVRFGKGWNVEGEVDILMGWDGMR